MSILETGEITVEGRLVDASNATLFVEISDGATQVKAIYKPVAGERPLWDFPDGNLASRERAAYLIDKALSFNHIPLTILREGPFGFGMVQQWIDVDEEIDLELHFRKDDHQLRQVSLLDAVINNTDRKIGHLLPSAEGHLYVCDHGVTFHVDDKLRTVLWQWAGVPLTDSEIASLEKLLLDIDSGELVELESLITDDEIAALIARTSRLIATRTFPEPNHEWPHIPWPPF
ncbi:Conserved hypothetical protein CHP03843 [Candidatus Nanopelagicaceae bacterium]